MSWFPKIVKLEPTAPDGTPLSEWDEYRFEPKEDITAYEFSILFRELFLNCHLAEDPTLFCLRKDRTGSLVYEPQFFRHFKKIEK